MGGPISRVASVKTLRNSCAQTFMGAISGAGCSICVLFCSTQFLFLTLSGNESLSRHFPRYSGGARAVDGVGYVRAMSEPVVVRRSNDGMFSARCACRSSSKVYFVVVR